MQIRPIKLLPTILLLFFTQPSIAQNFAYSDSWGIGKHFSEEGSYTAALLEALNFAVVKESEVTIFALGRLEIDDNTAEHICKSLMLFPSYSKDVEVGKSRHLSIGTIFGEVSFQFLEGDNLELCVFKIYNAPMMLYYLRNFSTSVKFGKDDGQFVAEVSLSFHGGDNGYIEYVKGRLKQALIQTNLYEESYDKKIDSAVREYIGMRTSLIER